MVITFKKFKHHAALSQETTAFTADIYADGKLVGHARNSGEGAETYIDAASQETKPKLLEAFEWAKTLPPIPSGHKDLGPLPMDLPFYLDLLANVYIVAANRKNKANGFITLFDAKAHAMNPEDIDMTGVDTYPEFRMWRIYNGGTYKPTEAVI